MKVNIGGLLCLLLHGMLQTILFSGGQESKVGAQQQGLGMQALPRPPPLTIPFDGSVSVLACMVSAC